MTSRAVSDDTHSSRFDPEALIGKSVDGKYAIEETKARGGTSIVYKARNKAGGVVALKITAAPRTTMSQLDEELIGRFKREGKTLAKMDHPNIVPIFDTGMDESVLPHYDIYYIAMKLMDGETLAERLEKLEAGDGSMAWSEVRTIIQDVAAALNYIHSHDFRLVHRDVTPSNIMLVKNQTYLFDFGLVKALSFPAGAAETKAYTHFKKLTVTGVSMGTPAYWSPEQIESGWIKVDHRADIYALGGVLYRMVTGELPYKDDILGLSHWQQQPPRPSRVNSALFAFDDVVTRAMAKHPDDRYQSAGELAQALTAAIELTPDLARGEEFVKARGIASRIPVWLGGLLTVFALIFVGIHYLSWFQPPASLPPGWQSSTMGVSMVTEENDDYLVTVTKRNTSYDIIEAQMVENPYISVEAQLEFGPEDTAYGLVFQRMDDSNYYAFGVTGSGKVGIWQLRDGIWHTPPDVDQDHGWVSQKYVHKDRPNRIEITIEAGRAWGWINSQPVFKDMKLDETHPANAGLFVSTPRDIRNRATKIHFSNFIVKK